MARMTGGEAIAATVAAHGIDTVYGLPGAQVYGLFDALHRQELRVVTPRHEQTCGYMALGRFKATGAPSAYAVVPGPGVLNTGAALLTAWGCNAEVLCLTGQVPRAFLGRGRGHLHEMRDQRGTLEGMAKAALHAGSVAEAGGMVAEAFRLMRSGRPGPVAVEMPWDVFLDTAETEAGGRLDADPDPDPGDAVGAAAAAIARAERPMIFVGSGALGAEALVTELAERIGAPAVAFRSGRGVVPNAHALGLTVAEARHLWAEVDCLIGIGTRLEVPGWRWTARPEVPVVRIDIDAAELERTPDALALHGRAAPTVAALIEAVPAAMRTPWRERIAAARERTAGEIGAAPHVGHLRAIREVLPPDGIFVEEICQAGFSSLFAFPVEKPRTFLSSGYQGTLGSGYPMALGAADARPDVPVVSIAGDGGFMFVAQELATAARYGLGVVSVVFDNGAFGNVRRDQVERFGGRLVGSELENPDFAALAEVFGVRAARADSPEALRAALTVALEAGGPWLVHVPVTGAEPSPWPFLGSA
ncbi:thiamine pyrophosphate-dependent enzyme [Wenxinia marina]|uniref:Thiamine pyrophosphate-requiring enzyme n=1 Tax=Wenxinia marina DSM 24838 TaxID=1123501 RepID=A0A0D0P9X8_9RHOB|nr:thiamine pyrophosphate-dependent enzyme [Wenxinia marina]KIQ68316.1 Thiamine pyrophosphate-requiring enzyme [Wenxinia marina DSM 24838]GGL79683.1 hypothetical protein GCM10011392_37660 [Wenxinia marina]